ncbi:COG4223 family protein [Sinorhizobium sp. BG8]|uniref:COG4223 family protein n=1 Tax=Sinorhizobium sp. BG8 TaxID=2613773 RepID=UPI00193E106B|nr:COG4223 family protein [Sinorhizobium sp. BG8]QRM53455.1 hypothetical protein F3Y30_01910 [Sinorhizobium sp. BG8]
MDPDKPSRRQKSDQPPVTIEIESPPIKESDPHVPAEQEVDTAVSAQPEETVADAPVGSEAAASEKVAEEENSASTTFSEAESHSYFGGSDAAKAPEPVPPRRGSAGPLAAGILGGLIALVGAGSLQYGGYLPFLGPQEEESNAAVDALSEEVASLKATLAQAPSASPDLVPLETRIASLEQSLANAPSLSSGNTTETSTALASLEAKVSALSTELATVSKQAEDAARASSGSETQLDERLAVVEQKLEKPEKDVSVARAMGAATLKTAIDRGGPYLAELEALASVAPDDPAIAGLRERAAVGVVSRSQLAATFPDTADKILAAIHQPQGDEGVIARLMSSATSAIRIRPVGSVEGDSPEAIVARIEDKVRNGDLKGAAIEWEVLPEAGKAAGADYKTLLDQRVAVEDLVGAVVSRSMSSTGTQG